MATPPNVPAIGFCVYVKRIRQEHGHGQPYSRTVSEYQCYWDNQPLPGFAGQMVEVGGHGDNSSHGSHKHVRIEARTKPYPLAIQEGDSYVTYNYDHHEKLPGLLLEDTGSRTGILIHPCHDAAGYLSSIGCFNPGHGLVDATSRIDLADSKARVVALINELSARLGAAFPKHGTIPHAVVVVEGEPS